MNNDWHDDHEWAEQFNPEIFAILERNAIRFVRFERATLAQDTREATDIVVVTDVGTFGKRIRREGCNFRDVTIRYRRRSGSRWVGGYEADKIIAGHARAYIYAWVRP